MRREEQDITKMSNYNNYEVSGFGLMRLLILISPHTSRVSVFSRLTRAHPGEVTLVALGPLTNLAIGLLADPGLGARLASLYIMGGNMEAIGNVTTSAEFNFHADPEAAHTVLRCP